MDNNLSAPIKKRHLRQLTILNNKRRDIMDRLFEGDRFCNRPTVSLQFGLHHHVKITSCYPANFSFQVGSSCWTRLPWIILGIGVGISNMVYHTYTLKMVDSNVRDALTTLSILFESLMSFSIGSFVRDPRRDSSVRIDIVHLVARNFPRESSLLDEEKLYDRSLRGDIIFQEYI